MRYLLHVRLSNKGDLWTFYPMNSRKGERFFKVDLSNDDLKTLLRKMKAKDEKTSPRSSKGRTYQQMIDDAKSGRDNQIWVWNTFYPMTADVAMKIALD